MAKHKDEKIPKMLIMASTYRYLEPRRAVPMKFVRPTRTSRILTPGLVFATIVILLAASIMGLIIAVSIFDSANSHKPSESVAQILVVIAASISIIYSIFHFIAVLVDEPMGIVRPPEVRVHGYCIISAKLALIAWIFALILSSIVASKPTVCLRGSRDCSLQMLDVVCSASAFLVTGVILTALESCHDPFAIPKALYIPRRITCRVSAFGDSVLHFDKSTRTSVHEDESVFEEIRQLSAIEQRSVTRKPLTAKAAKGAQYSIPAEFPVEHLVTPPPVVQRFNAKGWGDEWTYLVQDKSSSDMTRTYSSTSTSESSSSETSESSRSSDISVSKKAPRLRTVTPSSSISNLSRRSPLSTVRSIELPDVPIPAQLRYLPPVIGATHDWKASRTASIKNVLPVADVHNPQRRKLVGPTPLRSNQPIPEIAPALNPKFKRKTLDVKIPGSFVEHIPSLDDQIKLVEHRRKIEQGPISWNQAGQKKPRYPISLPCGEFDKHYTPATIDSRSRYRRHKRGQSSSQTARSAVSYSEIPVCMKAMKIQYVKPSKVIRPIRARKTPKRKVKHIRRLTLGGVGPNLGK